MITAVHHHGVSVSHTSKPIKFYRESWALNCSILPIAAEKDFHNALVKRRARSSLKLALLKAGDATAELARV